MAKTKHIKGEGLNTHAAKRSLLKGGSLHQIDVPLNGHELRRPKLKKNSLLKSWKLFLERGIQAGGPVKGGEGGGQPQGPAQALYSNQIAIGGENTSWTSSSQKDRVIQR